MNKLFVIFFIILSGCSEPEKELLIAEEQNHNEEIHSTIKLQFVLHADHTFLFSFINKTQSFSKPIYIKGNYSIKDDTIYFSKNERFKKAILKNGYLELLGEPLKIKIRENHSTLQSKERFFTPNDFTFFTFSPNQIYPFEHGKSVNLNETEINRIRAIIQHEMNSEPKRFYKHSNESEYVKQCIAIVNEKNEKEVWVNCVAMKRAYLKGYWRNQLLLVNDGGESYFNLKINLSTGKVYDFYVNGNG